MSKKSGLREWARENIKGLENCLMPSFTPDLSELDEEGIRWDVQQSIKHGFFSTLCTCEAGLTFEEAKRFIEIVADEAKGKILVDTTILFDSLEQSMEMLKHAKRVGCHCALLGYPPNFYPQSEEEIYRIFKEMCDSVPDLAIILYPAEKYNFGRFHPSGFPLDLLRRMADIENVVALKVGIPDLGFIFEAFHQVGDKVLVSVPMVSMLPILVPKYNQQWAGAAQYELFQSPDKPYLVDFFNLLLQGETDEAMEIYWRLTPVRKVWEMQMMQTAGPGLYHWPMFKYYQWLVGGNGGYTRQPVLKLYQHDMDAARNAVRAIGITPRENDEEFYVGRMNYAKLAKSQ